MANLFTIFALDVNKIDSLTTHAAKVSAKLFSELDLHFPPFLKKSRMLACFFFFSFCGLLNLRFFLAFEASSLDTGADFNNPAARRLPRYVLDI